MRHISGVLHALVAGLFVLLLGVSTADAGDGRVPLPSLAKGKGETCLEPNAEMRRYHMVYLKHQRDETMHRGIRGNKYSLKACVDCHAVPDPQAPGSKVRTIKPFCAQCHEYAAVHVDCFTCHASSLPVEERQGSGEGKSVGNNVGGTLKSPSGEGSQAR